MQPGDYVNVAHGSATDASRRLPPTPPASPLPSGYAYTLIPIASSAPRCFAGYCLDPATEFLRNSGERDATHLFYCIVRRVRIERETIEAFCRTRRETSCQNFARGCVLDRSRGSRCSDKRGYHVPREQCALRERVIIATGKVSGILIGKTMVLSIVLAPSLAVIYIYIRLLA